MQTYLVKGIDYVGYGVVEMFEEAINLPNDYHAALLAALGIIPTKENLLGYFGDDEEDVKYYLASHPTIDDVLDDMEDNVKSTYREIISIKNLNTKKMIWGESSSFTTIKTPEDKNAWYSDNELKVIQEEEESDNIFNGLTVEEWMKLHPNSYEDKK